MNIIIFAFILGIVFITISFFIDTIVDIAKLSNYDNKVSFALKWFFYIAMMNIIILILILYYNYYMNNQGLIGSTGIKGFNGSKGLQAPDCVTSYCVKNNTFPPNPESTSQ
jgi:hypothetical protein